MRYFKNLHIIFCYSRKEISLKDFSSLLCVVNLNFLLWIEWPGFNDEKIISNRKINDVEGQQNRYLGYDTLDCNYIVISPKGWVLELCCGEKCHAGERQSPIDIVSKDARWVSLYDDDDDDDDGLQVPRVPTLHGVWPWEAVNIPRDSLC